MCYDRPLIPEEEASQQWLNGRRETSQEASLHGAGAWPAHVTTSSPGVIFSCLILFDLLDTESYFRRDILGEVCYEFVRITIRLWTFGLTRSAWDWDIHLPWAPRRLFLVSLSPCWHPSSSCSRPRRPSAAVLHPSLALSLLPRTSSAARLGTVPLWLLEIRDYWIKVFPNTNKNLM